MKTYIVDTNLILRFLTNDIPSQADKVATRFREAEKGKIKLVILSITVVEVVFQLEHWYKCSKIEMSEKLLALFAPEWMTLENKAAIFDALREYQTKNIDFVDLLLWSIAKNMTDGVLSFDQDFKKLEPMIKIEP